MESSCGYCNSNIGGRHKIAFRTTKLNTDHYDKLIERGFVRWGGAFFSKSVNEPSCCHIFNPRVDIDQFKISKQQKKHMKRFNQYMNGEREFKLEPKVEENYDEYEATLKYGYHSLYMKEINKLKELISEAYSKLCIFKDTQSKKSISQNIRISTKPCKALEDPLIFTCNIIELMKQESDKYELADRCILLTYLKNNFVFRCLVVTIETDLYSNDLWFSPKTIKSTERVKQILNELDPSTYFEPNQYGEKRYKETGRETEISIQAGKSRDYEEYFDEFGPNSTPKDKRKHRYTFSIHPAVYTQETFRVYKGFKSYTFDKENTRDTYEKFLGNSCLYDPKEPGTRKTYTDLSRLDGDREFKDMGLCPQYNGTYHLHHRIDDELFAVTVGDLTPTFLLSSFCFYDPRYKFLSPGIFGAIREIEFMKQARKELHPTFQYYSMKDVVVSGPKMEYKEHLYPTYLKGPISLDWVLLTPELKKRVLSKNYITLNPNSSPYEKQSVREVTEWLLFQRVVKPKLRKNPSDLDFTFSPLICYTNHVTESLGEIYIAVGKQFEEMFCIEYRPT